MNINFSDSESTSSSFSSIGKELDDASNLDNDLFGGLG